jgi:hypothetical protein
MPTYAADESFIDLEIRIFQREKSGYPVELTLGEEQEFPRGYLASDVIPWVRGSDPAADGQRLSGTLLADGSLREAWAEARGQAPQRRIRLRIDPAAAELHALPWELLPEGPAPVSARADTPFSCYLPIALPWGGAVEERPIRVLAAISDPNDIEEQYNLPHTDLGSERESLLSAFSGHAKVAVGFVDPPVTPERLEEKLREGQIWGSEADARGEVLGTPNPRVFWTGLLSYVERSEFPRYELIDTLMEAFIERLPEALHPEGSHDTLTGLLGRVGWDHLANDPNEVHHVLVSLDLPLYLTTNYDSCMTEALAARGREPQREICLWNDDLYGLSTLFEDDPTYEPTPEAPLVYHLFGSDEVVESLVLAEDDYLDFLVRISAEMERIHPTIWAALANSSLIFLGCSLHDWEFRMILHGLVATRRRRHRFKHAAVQLEQEDLSQTDAGSLTGAGQSFLQQYFQDAKINVFWGSVGQFVAELRERWDAGRG